MNKAFTMAEILLSLTIIGVVAAITLPSLTGNINERTWNTQRKALYARFLQAISLMPALNGYGMLTEDESGSITADTATETFVTAGLSQVFKINNICDNEHLPDCGITTSFTNMAGSRETMPTTLFELSSDFANAVVNSYTYSTINTKAAAFETQNGESILAFYNKSCTASSLTSNGDGVTYALTFPEASACLNFIYDLNGNKGPNTVGKDIGVITVFNATDSNVVAPMPFSSSDAKNGERMHWNTASSICTKENSDSRIPNVDELASMMINNKLINLSSDGCHWSGTTFATNTNKAWHICSITGQSGYLSTGNKDNANLYKVRCIRR